MPSNARLIASILTYTALSVGTGMAQSNSNMSEFAQRFDAFCLLFADVGLPLAQFRELRSESADNYGHWVLVILGDPNAVLDSGLDLTTFVQRGGSLLFANDRDSLVTIGRKTATRSGPVITLDLADRYHGNPELPIVRDFLGGNGLFAGVRELATNVPGSVVSDEREWNALGSFPSLPSVPRETFLVGRDEGRGRYLVISDPSVFTNEMIQEADNARFAQNVVDWLRHGRVAANLNTTVVIDGNALRSWIDPRFETGDWNRPEIDSTALLNELLAGLQGEDALNELVRGGQESLSHHGPWPVRQAVLILLATFVVSAVIWRIFAARGVNDVVPAFAKYARSWVPGAAWQEPSALIPADRLLEHRQREIAKYGNYVGALRELAASFFQQRFRDVAWHKAKPRVTSRLGFWATHRLRRQIRSLWAIAKGESANRVTESGFLLQQEEMKRIEVLVRRGDVTIRFPEIRPGD